MVLPLRGEFLYSEAAYLVCVVLGRSCRMKTALYESSFKTDLRRLYALGCNTLKNYNLLTNTLVTSGFLSQVSDSSHLTAKEHESSDGCLQCTLTVLAHDVILGSKRTANHQLLMRTISSITGDSCSVKKIRQAYQELKNQGVNQTNTADLTLSPSGISDVQLPCYARVNLLLSTLTEVLDELISLGFEKRAHDPVEDSYKRFLKRIRKMKTCQFMLDHHLPEELIVFPPGSKLYQLDLVKSHRLILQDKASCIPPNVLNPIYDGDALDACAAPGNKTIQLVYKLSPKSTLFAVDRDPTRLVLFLLSFKIVITRY
ncbi:putative methyltransferase NSUN5 [Fasciola hepatica]|uniref:Methyltransferase NSUN5 n=1 Tax=Fasciola hepatica TaxID=6192 RepID=A0A4E0QXP7_FASHE|nr:putative methyltransferase NSUN5 [Fasciola hepatica]